MSNRRCTRLGFRTVTHCSLFALVAACTSACTSESTTPPAGQSFYLALGDSIAFGWTPLVEDKTQTELMEGYPEKLAQELGLDLVNASCPGEATGGFISLDGVDNGCRMNRAAYPLHVAYEGAQLDFALTTLEAHPETAIVTFDLGANDLSMLNDMCAGDRLCVLTGLDATLAAAATNLDAIFDAIRSTAGYSGPLVVLTYYALDYSDSTQVAAFEGLNDVIVNAAEPAGAIIADGFGAFEAAASGGSSCTAGLLAPLEDGTCDPHPSVHGQEVLAGAVRAALDGAGITFEQ